MIGIGDKYEYVTPRMASAGDSIIITKGPAIEATGIFATMFPRLIAEQFGTEFIQQAQHVFYPPDGFVGDSDECMFSGNSIDRLYSSAWGI